jgi:hypothetical protein
MSEMDDKVGLPNTWREVNPEQIYQSQSGLLVAFSSDQVRLGLLYDSIGKHLRAINKGMVSPKGSIGLVPSEEVGFDLKSKILGKGGDRRFHGMMIEEVLYFPGKQTTH